ncbi:MAG: hydantoinase/oxoprolinase family protein [Myxococcota bacterium]
MPFSISIDTGGTFTDLVLSDEIRIRGLHKAPTTPAEPFEGIRAALEEAARAEGRAVESLLAETATIVYATTHATNAILEGRTARTAFLTTEGHRDILLYREGGKQEPFNLARPYPDPLVPRSLCFELPERVLADGTIARPLDEAATCAVLERLRALEIEAVGVCLLWSIANPEHERRVGALLDASLPSVPYTLSHRVNPKLREYRRASSTVLDASLKPLMRTHLRTIDARLRALGFRGEPLMVTHLSGGVLGLGEMCEAPIHCVDSGPALAPVAGLVYASAEAAFEATAPAAPAASDERRATLPASKLDVLVVDAGGTSVDISPTRDGRVVSSREKWLGPRWIGHMTGLPAVETRSIGAGGGSIASVDAEGLLTVGPRSAGAVPGPACYARGGEHATVTDAALLLGRLDPDYFLAGRMPLSIEQARAAVTRRVAEPLGVDVEEAAAAILAVFGEHLRSFLSEMTIVQGLDPRECLIVAGGGAAGLDVVSVARELGVPRVVIPSFAAGMSAVGGQYADLFTSTARSLQTTSTRPDRAAIEAALEAIDGAAEQFFSQVAADGTRRRELLCEARYANQLWELDVALPADWRGRDEADWRELALRFDRLHSALFSVAEPGAPLELLGLRGEARVTRPHPTLAAHRAETGSHSPPPSPAAPRPASHRGVRFAGEARARASVPVYRGRALPVGARIVGPAIIEEETTTIVLDPGAVAEAAPAHYSIRFSEDTVPGGPR